MRELVYQDRDCRNGKSHFPRSVNLPNVHTTWPPPVLHAMPNHSPQNQQDCLQPSSKRTVVCGAPPFPLHKLGVETPTFAHTTMWRSIRFCAGYVVFVHFHHTAAIGQPDTPESDLLNPSASEQSRDQHNHATSLMGIGRTRSSPRIMSFLVALPQRSRLIK